MGKYKNLRPAEVAQKGLNNLLNKIPQMIQGYTNAMERFIDNICTANNSNGDPNKLW